MPYRLDIPGQVSEIQLRAIEAVATLVPKNGCVVEVGSLFGLSSWAWAKSVPRSASVFCIDPWEGNEGIRSLEIQHGVKYGLEQFKAYTKDCDNITAIPAYSPDGVRDWKRPVDLYYEDAVHRNPVLTENIEFWTSHLTPNGVVCGDDYRPRFPDVRAAAQTQAEARGRKLWVVDFFWCVLPDRARVPAVAEVEKTLAGLVKEVARERARSRPLLRIGPVLPIPQTLPLDKPAPFVIRVVNDGGSAWPSKPGLELKLLTSLTNADGEVVAASTSDIGAKQLGYDEPFDLPITLPFGENLPDEVTLRVNFAPGPELGLATISPFQQRLRLERPPEPAPEPDPVSEPPYEFGSTVSLTAEGNPSAVLGAGWHPPERLYAWTSGVESELIFEVGAATTQAGWFNVRLTPFMGLVPSVVAAGRPGQRLTITINEVEAFSGLLSSTASLSLPLPGLKNGRVQVRMTHPDAYRPSEAVAGSKDQRTLAFAVESVALSERPLAL